MKKQWFPWLVVILLVLWIGLFFGCQKKAPAGLTEDQARAIGDWYLKARNEANLALLDNIYAPGIVVHDPTQPANVVGLDALKAEYGATHAAVPDLKFTMDEMYFKGDRIVWVFTMTGTITKAFRTPLGEIPPTGNAFKLTGVAIDRIVDGKIAEEWLYFNPAELLIPLGFKLMPPSAPPAE